MLDITVKTMDSQSRSFQVPESMSVGDFKRRICDSVNIAVDSQRLIFQGRVLGDTMKLTSDHHEKTLHLVQRAQSSTSTSATGAATTSGSTTNSGTSRPTTTSAPPPHPHLMPTLDILNQMFAGQGMFAGTPVIGRVHHQGTSTAADGSMNIEINLEDPRSFTQQPPSTSQHQHSRRAAADSRVNFERMWRTLQLLTNIADTHSSTTTTATTTTTAGSENNEQISSESTPDETGNTSTTTGTDSTTAQDNSRLASGGTSNIHSQNSRPRLRQPLVSELRDFYSQFTQVQGRLQPMFNQYQRFLQDDPAFTSTNSREYQDSCGFFQLVPQVLRYMADIYDFLANISIPLERVPPRPVMMTNNNSRSSRRSSNRAPSGGITLGQMVRSHQQQTTTPPPSGGISSTQRTSTNTATGRRRFCMHQPGRSGSAAASATGSSGGSPTTTQRRSNRPSTTGTTSGSGGNTQQSATSTTQQRTLPPYAFQINTIFYQRATQLPSSTSSSTSSGDSGQQGSGTTTSATTTSATTTSATNETTTSNQQQEQDSTNVTATSSLSSTQQEQGGEQQGEGGEQQGIEERKRKNPTLPDSSDVSSNKKSK